MKLKVGEDVEVGDHYAFYAGMINKNTFSFGIKFDERFLMESGYNIFYPTNIKKIKINKIYFEVMSVTPKEIILEEIDKE